MRKQWILLVVSLLVLVLYFSVPIYHHWLFSRLLGSPSVIVQARKPGIRQRLAGRFGKVYTELDRLGKEYRAKGATDEYLLLPPDAYIQQQGIRNFHMPEPLEFYYFSGIRSVNADHPAAPTARWTVTIKDSTLQLLPIDSTAAQQLIAIYNKHTPR